MFARFVTAGVGIPLFLGLLYLGGAWWAIFMVLLTVIGSFEMGRMTHRVTGSSTPSVVLFTSAGVLYVFAAYQSHGASPHVWGPITFALLLAAFLREIVRPERTPVQGVGGALLGAVYPGALFAHLVLLRGLPNGFAWVLFVTLGTWASDSAAYFIGSAFGRRKLIPQVSPNKTCEGALGGVAGAALIGLLFGMFTEITVIEGLLGGVLISIAGQLGDLAASTLKRQAGVKDTGALLPGHGGVLDRFDSLLFAGPVVYYGLLLMRGWPMG